MPTVFANGRGAVTKADSGISMAFPDVCVTPTSPAGPGGVPIPYPNIAATAQKKLAAMKTQKTVAATGSSSYLSRGDAAGTMKGMASGASAATSFAVKSEIGLIRSNLSALNARLQALPAGDPNEWQALLQEYLVLASALYLAQKDD
jgi:hypothetical protein